MANMSFNVICENKILAKITEFIVHVSDAIQNIGPDKQKKKKKKMVIQFLIYFLSTSLISVTSDKHSVLFVGHRQTVNL